MVEIDKTAVVSNKAEIDEGVYIGPYSVIGDKVRIFKGVRIGRSVIIENRVTIGENTTIGHFSSVGVKPQDLKYKGEDTELIIGKNNQIREYVNIAIGSVDGNGKTIIGDNNLIMSYSHIAHDCVIHNNVIMANLATLGGHVEIFDYAVIGGMVGIHQFVKIGAYVMVGGGSMVTQDIPPFILAEGNRAKPYGLNTVGLKRRGFTSEQISILKRAYRYVYSEGLSLKESLIRIEEELVPQMPELRFFVEFIRGSKRGIIR
jgi:UDP-N-acetylglucosamine acyltransferase